MVAPATIKQGGVIPDAAEPPLVGSMFAHNNHRLRLYLRVAREYGDIARYHYGPFPFIQVNSSELVHSVLVEHAYDFFKGDAMYKAFSPVIGNGLFISEGESHRRQRKLIAPSFQPRQIVSYADTMVAYGEQIQRTWRDEMTVDIGQEMTHVTMSIVGKVLFDADVFTEADELGAAVTTVLREVNYQLSHLFPIPLSWPTPQNKRAKRALAILNKRIHKMIEERRTNPEERNDFLMPTCLSARDLASASATIFQ